MRFFGKDSEEEGDVKDLNTGELERMYKTSSILTGLSAPKSTQRLGQYPLKS